MNTNQNVVTLDNPKTVIDCKVWSPIQGWGEIKNIDKTIICPLLVEFGNWKCWFLENGKRYEFDLIPSLFYEPQDILLPKEPEYEWQWIFKDKNRNIWLGITEHRTEEYITSYHKKYPEYDYIKIEESKREVKIK